MADRFKVQTDEQVLFKGPLVYRQSKWGRVSCQGVLTTRRLVLGRKLNPMWGWGVRLYVLFAGRKIEFQIPLDHLDSVRHDEEENELYFILKTTEDLEYRIRSDSLVGKNNNDWIRAITDAVRLANPGVVVREQATSVEFVTSGSESESTRRANDKEKNVDVTVPATPVHLPPSEITSPVTFARSAPQVKRNTEKIILAVIGGLVVIGVIAIAVGALYFKQRGPRPPKGMVYVPGGEFAMGRDDGDEYERPAHKVKVDPFFIDEYEVTNDEWKACVMARECHVVPPGWHTDASGRDIIYPASTTSRQPVNVRLMAFTDAYCKWAGKRLPTEEEWEFAARGTDGRRYPWGNDWRPGLANADGASSGLAEVGTYKGRSPFGAYDMAGNAAEWTAGKFVAYPGATWSEVYVRLDSERLTKYHVTVEEVISILHGQNAEVENRSSVKSSLQSETILLTVLWKSNQDPATLNGLIVATRNAYPVKINDLGYAELYPTRAVRGGSHGDSRDKVTTTYRRGLGLSADAPPFIGFRCVVAAPR